MDKSSKSSFISMKELLKEKTSKEFPDSVKEDFHLDKKDPVSRRKFLALLGASAAVTTVSCTDYRDKGEIIAYNKKPDHVQMGEANYYASTYRNGLGILIKTRAGRPIKVDGNPDHPVSKGKADTFIQSSLMDLYDPERLKTPTKGKENISWENLDNEIINKLQTASDNGKEIALITNEVLSPTQNKLFEDFKTKYSTVNIYSYELFDSMNRDAAWQKSYGSGIYPIVDWGKPDAIVALESDFLCTEGNGVEALRQFTSRRDPDNVKNFNRLYSFEGSLTTTGAYADYWSGLNPADMYAFVMALINEAGGSGGGYNIRDLANKSGMNSAAVNALVKDIREKTGKIFFHAGDGLPESIHIAVNLLNEHCGGTIAYNRNARREQIRNLSTPDELRKLTMNMKAGNTAVIIHFDSNPVYHFSPELGYDEALKNVETVISMTEMKNESSDSAGYVIPVNHPYESWGDYKLRSDVISLQQPVIASLYFTRQKEAILLTWIKGDPKAYGDDIYHKYLKEKWEKDVYPASGAVTEFKNFWYASLHDGMLEIQNESSGNSEAQTNGTAFNMEALNSIQEDKSPDGFTLIIGRSNTMHDGRYANNGWLQEIPHPVSKVVWDNYAAVSPKTAKEMGLEYKDNEASLIEIEVNGRKATLPVVTQPGTEDKVIRVEAGYGRKISGAIGENVGVNVNILMPAAGSSRWILYGAKASKAEGTYNLVSTQEHHLLDEEFVKDFHKSRAIIIDSTVEKFLIDKDAVQKQRLIDQETIEKRNVNPKWQYGEVKWGMAIDLNKCTGCGQCIAACNAENNIPIVGKEEVSKGREMQWIRIDRYYSNNDSDPIVSNQPMLCQHCDYAPCENVCPVVATTHSPDGLNQMTYNRCVGTRYCANNCPYKVRRFNFFDFREIYEDGYYYRDSLKLMNNPEVTVRSRGVMEKCTFCVQRIQDARDNARERGEDFNGSGVETACQQACPADAIVFGNLKDPGSKVAKLADSKLGYKVIEMLGVQPGITYLAKLRNKHSEDA
ncbi:MAG: 4Fe-4S dicluster domain-containing protein [Candidatus Kapaibacterium sp.]